MPNFFGTKNLEQFPQGVPTMPICIKPVYNIKLFLPHIIAHVTTMSQVERNILVSILLFT